MSHKLNRNYPTLTEGYGGGFSIYGSLLNNSQRTKLKDYDCWCVDSRSRQGGECKNQLDCQSCDLDKTGLCPQSSGVDTVPGVN